jgi:hypothetical protein
MTLRLSMRFLDDAETLHCMRRMATVSSLECSVCFEMGIHSSSRDLVEWSHSRRLLYSSSCGEKSHGTCTSCLSRLADDFFSSGRSVGSHSLRCPCTSGCSGKFSRRFLQRFASDASLARHEEILVRSEAERTWRLRETTHSALLPCPSCSHISPVSFTSLSCSLTVKCPRCATFWCTRCNSSGRNSACPCSSLPPEQLPQGWSRYFRREDGLPKRMHEITLADFLALVARVKESHKNSRTSVQCSGCDHALSKTSACNEMHHCGSRRACYICNLSSLPWEQALPSTHWEGASACSYDAVGHLFHSKTETLVGAACDWMSEICSSLAERPDHSLLERAKEMFLWSREWMSCPRWDSDWAWRGRLGPSYACAENHCFGEEMGECSRTSHAEGRERASDARGLFHVLGLYREFAVRWIHLFQ